MRLVSIRIASEQLHAVRYRRSARGQGRDRTADLPLFRSREHRIGAAKQVVCRAQRPSVISNRPRCTQVNETRNETTPGPAPGLVPRPDTTALAHGAEMAAVSVEAIAWAPNLAPAPTVRAGRPSSPCCLVLAGLANHAGPVLAARLSPARCPLLWNWPSARHGAAGATSAPGCWASMATRPPRPRGASAAHEAAADRRQPSGPGGAPPPTRPSRQAGQPPQR